MKTFEETFQDHIDMTDGTVVLTKDQFIDIQNDALLRAARLTIHSTRVESAYNNISELAMKNTLNKSIYK